MEGAAVTVVGAVVADGGSKGKRSASEPELMSSSSPDAKSTTSGRLEPEPSSTRLGLLGRGTGSIADGVSGAGRIGGET